MSNLFNCVNKIKIRVFTGFLFYFLFFGIIFIDQASAQTIGAQNSAFQQFVKQTQLSFERSSQETNQAISDLPQQLERVASEPQVAVRKQIEDDLENRQDLLENLADEVDDLAEKVESFNKKSLSFGQVAGSDQQIGLNIQQSLENVAQTIDHLADDVEEARDSSTPAIRTQIEQEIEAVNQALEGANSAFQGINSNPV